MKQTTQTLLVALTVVLVMVIVGSLYNPGSSPDTALNAAHASTLLDMPSQTELDSTNIFTQIYNTVSPSVVAIQVSVVARNQVIGSGTGSGFVLDQEGHIVTNNHVVESADQIEVEFYDGTLAWAEIVGVDPDSDLAVLKVDLPAEQLHPISFGDSDSLQVGETVLAIGSPFGENWTLTSGIISGLDRTIQGLNDFSIGGVIQTDAAINPGNSGGPLLDLEGHLIGVNAQIATTTESSSGVGFAIPGNLTQRVAQALIQHGAVEYSYMGISGGDLTLALIDQLQLPEDTRGVVVSTVSNNSPAAEAGLHEAGNVQVMNGVPMSFDIITAVDGHPLRGMDELISYLARYTTPGQTIQLTVLRDGQQQITLGVELTPRP